MQNFLRSAPQLAPGGCVAPALAHPSPLRGRQLEHRSVEECGSHHVLAGRAEDWGVVTPFVLDDAAVDVPGAASSLAPIPATGRVLDQGLAELAEAYALFFEPGLQLVELLEVRALPSYGADAAPRAPGWVLGVVLGGGVAFPCLEGPAPP